MDTIPTEKLSLASDAKVSHLSTLAEVVNGLKQLHNLVLEVCPGCLVRLRGPTDGGMVYVPAERANARTNRNLLTVWPKASGVRMRIMSDEAEYFDPALVSSYRTRLKRLLSELLARK